MADEPKQDVILRLKKIEGQVRGLQRMIDEGKECAEVVHQLSAARKALDKVGFIILSHLMSDCLAKANDRDKEKHMEEAMRLFLTLS